MLRMRTMRHTARGCRGLRAASVAVQGPKERPAIVQTDWYQHHRPAHQMAVPAICKRLGGPHHELQGEKLLDESREKKAEEERLNRHTAAALKMNEFKAKLQWQQPDPGPKDRLKKLFNEEVPHGPNE